MKYLLALGIAVVITLFALVEYTRIQEASAPFEVQRTEPDEYGVVCYWRHAGEPLSCVMVQFE